MTDERVTITDAAGLLGVHRNTVRNRIRRGMYPSARLDDDGHGGQVWTVDRADLDLPEGLGLPPRETRETPRGPTPETPETPDTVTRALAPLMAELVTLTDRLAQAQQERADAEVARRVAEHERDRLREERDRLATQLAGATAKRPLPRFIDRLRKPGGSRG